MKKIIYLSSIFTLIITFCLKPIEAQAEAEVKDTKAGIVSSIDPDQYVQEQVKLQETREKEGHLAVVSFLSDMEKYNQSDMAYEGNDSKANVVDEDGSVFMCYDKVATIVGTIGNDTLIGSDEDDVIVGLGGSDTILGLEGNDTLCGDYEYDGPWGGSGDLIYGGEGKDEIFGGHGNDTVYGGTHLDVIRGGVGDDLIYGDNGDFQGFEFNSDKIDGGNGIDTIYGEEGDDLVVGSFHDDRLYGGYGNDLLYGDGYIEYHEFSPYFASDPDDGIDEIYGGDGNDLINGVSKGDKLYGEKGDDLIFGGIGSQANWELWYLQPATSTGPNIANSDGADEIDGGSGDDYISARWGADTIIGGFGSDFIYGDIIRGAIFNNNIQLDYGADTIYGDLADPDVMVGIEDGVPVSAGVDYIFGGLLDDVIYGGPNDDHIAGEEGNDIIHGNAGDDVLSGMLMIPSDLFIVQMFVGNDPLSLSEVIYGDSGDDMINTGAWRKPVDFSTPYVYNNDLYEFLLTSHRAYGGSGDDTIFNPAWGATVDGGSGNDTFRMLLGNAKGGSGNDTFIAFQIYPPAAIWPENPGALEGGEGNDKFEGQMGESDDPAAYPIYSFEIYGDSGDDTIIGNSVDDLILDGGDGIDTIDGSTGTNYCYNSEIDINCLYKN